MLKKQFVVAVLFLSISALSRAQFPDIDSIKMQIDQAGNDRQKLSAIRSLMKYVNSLHPDTATRYFSLGRQLAERLADKPQMRWAEYALLSGSLAKGKTDSVLYKIGHLPLLTFSKTEDTFLFYKIQLLKANALNRMNNRIEALKLQLGLLNEAQTEENFLAQAYLLNYLGATYINLENRAEAHRYWMKALQLIRENPDTKLTEIEAVINSNLMLYYHNQIDSGKNRFMTDSFLLFTEKVIDQSRQNHIYWLLPTALSFRGDYHGLMKKVAEGEQDFSEAISIRQKIGDPLYMANDMIHLASFYAYQEKYDSSIAVLQRVQQVIKKGHLNELTERVLSLLSYSFKKKMDFRAYSEALEQFILNADTANRLNAADKIADINARYDVQRKEATITRQKLQLAQRFNYIIAALLLMVMLIPLSWIYIQRVKKMQKEKSRIAVLTAEENERKRIAAELHDNLGVQANAILHNSTLLTGDAAGNDLLVGNLQNTAREMLANLRETVWALKTTEVSCADTWLRLISFTGQVKRNFSAIRFNISGESPSEVFMDSVRALHIVMVVKEAVNNAIRHAAATDISITGTFHEAWVIRITDNGSGFKADRNRYLYSGNGLSNMRDRANSGKFNLRISGEPGVGTVIELKIPLQPVTI